MPLDAALPRSYQLTSNDEAFWIEGVDSLKLPIMPDGIPFGDAFARNLRACLTDPRIHLSVECKKGLEQLCLVAAADHCDYGRYRSSAVSYLDGLTGRSPYYEIFVGNDDGSRERHICRLLALHVLIVVKARRPRGSEAALEAIKEQSRAHFYFNDDRREFRDLINGWTGEQADFGALFRLLRTVLKASDVAIQALFSLIYCNSVSRDMLEQSELRAPASGLNEDDASDLIVAPEPPTFLPAALEADDEEPSLFIRQGAANEDLQIAYSAQVGRLHLEGAVIPDTDRVLCTVEGAAVSTALLNSIPGALRTQNGAALALNSVATVMSLITSRPRRRCILALLQIPLSATADDGFTIDETSWSSRNPFVEKYGALPQDRSDSFQPTGQIVQLGLSEPVASAISALRAHLKADKFTVLIESEKDIVDFRRMLKKICPRATERRIKATLPVLVNIATGDLRVAQLIAGNDLGHSVAPLSYFASESERIRNAYGRSLQMLEQEITRDLVGGMVGAPRATLKFDAVKTAVMALRRRSEQHLADSDLIVRLNGVTLWTVAGYGAAVLSRWNNHIERRTRRDSLAFDSSQAGTAPIGIEVHTDKYDDGRVNYRVCGLGSTWMAQEEVMFSLQQRVLEESSIPRSALRPLRDSLNGVGPCFLFCRKSASGELEWIQVDKTLMMSEWPEWPGPLSLWRHFTASNHHQYGARACDVAQQLGHSLDGTPFSEVDPDVPYEFARRIASMQDRLLEDVGFGVIGKSSAKSIKPPQFAVLTLQRVVELDRLIGRSRANFSKSESKSKNKLSKEESEALVERIDAWLQQRLSSQIEAQELMLGPALVGEWLHAFIATESEPFREFIPTHFLNRLFVIQKDHAGWKIGIPPAAASFKNADSSITPATLLSRAWMLSVIERCLSRLHDSDELALTARLILLGCYSGFCTVDRLLGIAMGAKHVTVHPSLADAVVIGVPRRTRPDFLEAFVVQGEGAKILASIARLDDISEPDLREAISDSKLVELLKDVLGKSPNQSRPGMTLADIVLSAIAHGRALVQPGLRAAYERGDVDAVNLSVERMLAIAKNECVLQPDGNGAGDSVDVATISRTHRMSNTHSKTALAAVRETLKIRDETQQRLGAARQIKASELARGRTKLASIVAIWVAHALEQDVLAISAIERYLSALAGWMEVHATSFESGTELDDELLSDSLEILMDFYPDDSAGAASLHSALTHFLPVLGQHCDIENTLSVAGELQAQPVPANGYGASVNESSYIDSAARHFLESKRSSVGTTSGKSAAAFAAAVRLAQKGARVGESSGLAIDAWQFYGNVLIFSINRRRGAPLKTLASKRPLVLILDDQDLSWWRSTLESLKTPIGSREGLLCIRFPSRRSTRRLHSKLYGYVSRHVLPSEAARSHHPRHDLGRVALAHCVPGPWNESIAALADPAVSRAPHAPLVPARTELLCRSRGLGHGSQHSIVNPYCNVVGLIGANDFQLPRLNQRHLAELAGIKHTAFRARTSRAKRARANGESTILSTPSVRPPFPAEPKFREPAAPAYLRILSILVRWKAMFPRNRIQSETDTGEELLTKIIDEAEMLKVEHGIEFRPETLGMRLAPHEQAAIVLQILSTWVNHCREIDARKLFVALISNKRMSEIDLDSYEMSEELQLALAKLSGEQRKLVALSIKVEMALR